MTHVQLTHLYRRLHARDPQAWAVVRKWQACARYNVVCRRNLALLQAYGKRIAAMRTMRPAYAHAPEQHQEQQGAPPGPPPQTAPIPADPAVLDQLVSMIIAKVRANDPQGTADIALVQQAADNNDPNGIALLQRLAQDPAMQAFIATPPTAAGAVAVEHRPFMPRAVSPGAAVFHATIPSAHPAARVVPHPFLTSPTVTPPVFRPVHPGVFRPAVVPPRLRLVERARVAEHVVRRWGRPERFGGFWRTGHYTRPGWAWGRDRWFHPGRGWAAGWGGWRRPGWRGWGFRPGFGWVWGFPGALIIDESNPTEILAPQADGSAPPVDPAQVPAAAQQTPDPGSAPPADAGDGSDGGSEAQEDADQDEQEQADDSSSSDDSSGYEVYRPWHERLLEHVRPRRIIRRRWRDGWPHHLRANVEPPPLAEMAIPHPPRLRRAEMPMLGRGFVLPESPVVDASGYRYRPAAPMHFYRPTHPHYNQGQRFDWMMRQQMAQQQQQSPGDAPSDGGGDDASGRGYRGGFGHGGGWGGWGRRGWAGAGRGYGLWGGAWPGLYAPVYAEPEGTYTDPSLWGWGAPGDGDATGATNSSYVLPAAAAVLGLAGGPTAYLDTLAAQAASQGGLSTSQGSSPEEAINSDSVLDRAKHAASVFFQHGGQSAAAAAHQHVLNAARAGARNAPAAGWTMQPIIAQNALRLLGFYRGPINGIVDDATKNAVKAFQAANPPLGVDGIVGVSTQPVLEQAARGGLVNLQQRLQQAFGGSFVPPRNTVMSGALPAWAVAAAPPALGGVLGSLLGSWFGRRKPPAHLGPHHRSPPAWPPHMLVGGEKENAEYRKAIVAALKGLPPDQGQSEALRKYLETTLPAPTTTSGWPGCMPQTDWLRNPMSACVAVGYDPFRVAVGYGHNPQIALGHDPTRPATGGWFLPALGGAAAYAALDAYRWGVPHVRETVFGQYAPKVLDLSRRVQQGFQTSGLPERMRAGVDTSTQGSRHLNQGAIEGLAASMRRAVA